MRKQGIRVPARSPGEKESFFIFKTIISTFLVSQVLLALLLAGCGPTFDYEALRRQETAGDHFSAALSREYKAFALYEVDCMYDWPDAAHFGDKAMLSARGVVPTPERLSDSRLPATATGAIAAAHAQARFDCWVEQQGENWQIDDIARCSDDLHAALAELEKAELATGAASVHLAVYEHGVREGPAASEAYALFFAFDRADLAAEKIGDRPGHLGLDRARWIGGHCHRGPC